MGGAKRKGDKGKGNARRSDMAKNQREKRRLFGANVEVPPL